jgi:hypothetical protein
MGARAARASGALRLPSQGKEPAGRGAGKPDGWPIKPGVTSESRQPRRECVSGAQHLGRGGTAARLKIAKNAQKIYLHFEIFMPIC